EVKVKGTIHWLNEKYAKQVEVRTFENLLAENEEGSTNERAVADSFNINPNSLKVTQNAFVEDGVNYTLEERYQFVRNGFYCLDSVDSAPDKLVFNRVVDLKGSYKPQQ
ncbi:MAG: glutamine--tRNA ligase, partial [Clostridia bacterium]|nr:glutamine--tRNA ligase [Clostridia bacterium]